MWMLSFVPDSFLLLVIQGLVVAGAVGTFLTVFILHKLIRWFPSIAVIHYPLQIVSLAMLVGGVFFYGGYSTEAEWREKVHTLELQIAQMEEMSNDLNKKIEEERKKKQKVRVEYYNTVKTEIKEVEKIINADCKVPPIAIEKLNKAAVNPEGKK